MNRRRWMIGGILGGLAWAWFGLGMAQGGTIPPTNPTTRMLDVGASVTVSLYQLDSTLPSALTLQSPSRCTTTGTPFYKDITDCWLPEWDPINGGKSVFVVINGSTVTPTLVPPAPLPTRPLAAVAANTFLTGLTTSAYPGQCTNFGADTEADFELLGSQMLVLTPGGTPVMGYELKPKDCGGIAVIQVGSDKFLLPKDGTATVAANGLPDVWESLYGGSLDPATDIDTGPTATSFLGDGIHTGDEQRGFIVSGKQIRTDPRQKDLLLYVVKHADFPTSTSSYYDTYPAVIGESLFAVVYTLVAPERLHVLGPDPTNPLKTNEWVDHFVSLVPAQTLTIDNSVRDRIVNDNGLYGPAQKGVRVMEALNTNSPSVLGWSFGVASPNEAGNVVVFTQRIINYINSLSGCATTTPKTLKYSTAALVNGTWTWGAPASVDCDFVLSKAFQFYTGHEIHHSLDLTPGVQGTNKTSYGHHFAPGTGDCQDQAITTTSKGTTVTFYIPSVCGTADQTQFLIQ